MNAQERLSEKINSKSLSGMNKMKLFDYFGKANIEKLDFDTVEWENGPIGSDGMWFYSVNLKTGHTGSACEIAGGGPFDVGAFLKEIESAIHKKLDEL